MATSVPTAHQQPQSMGPETSTGAGFHKSANENLTSAPAPTSSMGPAKLVVSMPCNTRKDQANAAYQSNSIKTEHARSTPDGWQAGESLKYLGSIIQQSLSLPKRSLPHFDGNPLEYYGFMKSFEETICQQVAEPASQLQYLIDMCIGRAREVIKSCHVISPPAAGLERAMDLLCENFGQKHIVVQAHLDLVCNGPPVKSDQESLSKFATELTNCQIIMQAWGFDKHLDSHQTLSSIFKRLPVHLQRMFCNKVETKGQGSLSNFTELANFINQAAQRTNTFLAKSSLKGKQVKEPNLGCRMPLRFFQLKLLL